MSTTKTASMVICTLGLLAATQARAETIDITVTQSGHTIVAPVVFSSPTFVLVDDASLNTQLAAIGSAYQFSAFGTSGVSNTPGTPTFAHLDLTATVSTGATGNISPLTIMETETGFSGPSSGPAMLGSAATASFNGVPAGSAVTTAGSLGTTVLPTLALTSSSINLNVANEQNSITVPSFSVPFTLDNEMSFSLPLDSFRATLTVSTGLAAPNEIPLPAALPLFASGLGALGLLGWRRKRRSAFR